MLTEETNLINEPKNNKGCTNNMPCARFVVAAGITLASFTFGAIMLGTGGLSAPLAPFYTGLITGSVSYWCTPPSAKNN